MMQKLCKACSSVIPDFIRIGKKSKSLRSRVYCCECSPYKAGGRKHLEKFKIIEDIEHKFCQNCMTWLPLTLFNFSRSVTNGKKYPSGWCRECGNLRAKKRGQLLKQKAVAYKGGKCMDCGLAANPCVYDFHHIDPTEKDFIIARKLADWNMVKTELDKCVLLCSNCHRLRHYSN